MLQANQISRITKTKVSPKGIEVKSPAEKILEMLDSIRKSTKDNALKADLQWY